MNLFIHITQDGLTPCWTEDYLPHDSFSINRRVGDALPVVEQRVGACKFRGTVEHTLIDPLIQLI